MVQSHSGTNTTHFSNAEKYANFSVRILAHVAIQRRMMDRAGFNAIVHGIGLPSQ
jgi:hypothetical protein